MSEGNARERMGSRPVDRTKTLDELEGTEQSEPPDDSYLVTTCRRLRRKPVGRFSVEDLRIMIGQGIGLRHLVPLALEALEREPLAQGDYYPGDLLGSVLGVAGEFWAREWEWRDRVHAILAGLARAPEELEEAVTAFRRGTP